MEWHCAIPKVATLRSPWRQFAMSLLLYDLKTKTKQTASKNSNFWLRYLAKRVSSSPSERASSQKQVPALKKAKLGKFSSNFCKQATRLERPGQITSLQMHPRVCHSCACAAAMLMWCKNVVCMTCYRLRDMPDGDRPYLKIELAYDVAPFSWAGSNVENVPKSLKFFSYTML